MKLNSILVKISLVATFLIVLAPFFTLSINAQNACDFIVTKVRAQLNSTSPWTENLSVNKDTNPAIRIVAFQCTAAQTANCDVIAPNVVLTLNGAGFNNSTFNVAGATSIPSINLINTGTLTITATTPNQTGSGCTGSTTVNVTGTSTATCPYIITKFRSQLNSTSPWTENLSVNMNQNPSIRIVAFQCTSAQTSSCEVVAPDATIRLNGAGFNNNSYQIVGVNTIPTINLLQAGTINVSVTTPNQTAAACQASGQIVVTRPTTGGTPLPNTSQKGSITKELVAFVGLSFVGLGVLLRKNSKRI